MNKLKNTVCYLCGGMDRVADGGIQWRRHITPALRSLGIGVLDPSDKPTDFVDESPKFREEMYRYKSTDNFDAIRN